MEFGLPWPEWSGLLREEDLDLSARRAEDDRPRDLSTEPVLLGEREEEKEEFFLVLDLLLTRYFVGIISCLYRGSFLERDLVVVAALDAVAVVLFS